MWPDSYTRHEGTQCVWSREAGGECVPCDLTVHVVKGVVWGPPWPYVWAPRCHQLPHCAAHLKTRVFGVRRHISVSMSPGYCRHACGAHRVLGLRGVPVVSMAEVRRTRSAGNESSLPCPQPRLRCTCLPRSYSAGNESS